MRTLYFHPVASSFFCLSISSFYPRLISAVVDWMSTIYFHTWCGLSANLGCRSETLNSNISSTCFYNMVNFGPLAAKIGSLVWGTPANFNGFRILAALLHGTLVVGVSQTLRRSREGGIYIRQGGHHAGHWPTF